MERQSVSSGTIWEARYSFCRAIRYGERIVVAGTTATDPEGNLVGPGDAAAQTHYIIDKMEKAINELGGRLADVVRIRMYVGDMSQWEGVAMAHGERFKGINPVSTLVGAKLMDDIFLVEMEAEAIIGAGDAL